MTIAAKTVLIVEDEALIAMVIEETVESLGLTAILVSTVEQAVKKVGDGGIDLAILDYSLRDGTSEPVAVALGVRRIPFILCSGAPVDPTLVAFEGAPVLMKPYPQEELQVAIMSALRIT